MTCPAEERTIDATISALRAPSCYPHPVDSIAVLQTHCSCVFLTGSYAYKVKKPVKFPFLDYSTLERRKHFCEEEVRLNRRLCPDVYLDTVPITLRSGETRIGSPGESSLGPLGETVEWAVRMRQLRSTDMLPERLSAGSVTETDISRIARTLRRFHRDDCRAFATGDYSRPDQVARTIGNACDVMDQVAGDRLDAASRGAIRGFFTDCLRESDSLLCNRVNAGHVRDCHGDLRLQNICLDARFGEGLQIFDCIEFNDEFRYIDTAADIAYLAMDLDLAGRSDLRRVLMDEYGQAAEDRDLPRLLRFYQPYRAVVRGNIAALASAEHEIAQEDRQEHDGIAAAAYDLALSYTTRHKQAVLAVMAGFSGSGKSALARELSRRLPAVVLSSDRLRKTFAIAGGFASDRLQYTPARRAAVYAAMRDRAAGYLASGEHVILDATFLAPEEREAACGVAMSRDAGFWMIECRCPDSVIRDRLSKRAPGEQESDADLRIYEQQVRLSTPIALPKSVPLPENRHIAVDTVRSIANAAHDVIGRIRGR